VAGVSDWEDKCDRCGICCEGCFLFDEETRLCSDYENRFILNPKCLKLTPENIGTPLILHYLPASCAYLDESEEPDK
jgi:uncharacterized cysteine cluster protein YcgN (CxxCxxCC family)